jgi:hypothetical protein
MVFRDLCPGISKILYLKLYYIVLEFHKIYTVVSRQTSSDFKFFPILVAGILRVDINMADINSDPTLRGPTSIWPKLLVGRHNESADNMRAEIMRADISAPTL